MEYDAIDRAMAERLHDSDIKSYLTKHGWKMHRVCDSGIEVWRCEGAVAGSVLVYPFGFVDAYWVTVLRAAQDVADLRKCSVWEILGEMDKIRRFRVLQEKEGMILEDDPDAASLQKVAMWVSLDGRLCADESLARHVSVTHHLCKRCKLVLVAANRQLCSGCSDLRDKERYDKLPRVKWNGEGMLYSDAYSEFFQSIEDAEEFLDDRNADLSDGDLTMADMRLVIAEPCYAQPLSTDRWCDDLAPGEDVPDWLETAVEEFNKQLDGQAPLSYNPHGPALDLSDYQKESDDEAEVKEDEENTGV